MCHGLKMVTGLCQLVIVQLTFHLTGAENFSDIIVLTPLFVARPNVCMSIKSFRSPDAYLDNGVDFHLTDSIRVGLRKLCYWLTQGLVTSQKTYTKPIHCRIENNLYTTEKCLMEQQLPF